MDKTCENTCRACLRHQIPVKNMITDYIDELQCIKLSQVFKICTNIDIPDEDDNEAQAPQMICIMCELAMKTAYYFRMQCEMMNEEYMAICASRLIDSHQQEQPPIQENAQVATYELQVESMQENIKLETVEIDESTNDTVEIIPMPTPSRFAPSSSNYECPKCQKTFISTRYLEIHLKSHQNSNHECNICGKKCSSPAVLRIHQKKHNINDDTTSHVAEYSLLKEYLQK